jgi:hypothetical protein
LPFEPLTPSNFCGARLACNATSFRSIEIVNSLMSIRLWRQAKPFCHTSPKPASPPAGCRTPNSTTRPTEALLARVATKKRCAARIPLTCYCPELKPAKPAMRPARTTPNRAASNVIRITTGQREKKSRPLSVSPRQEPAASDSTATRTLIIRSRAKHVAAWI